MKNRVHIVIVGSGFGGLNAAKQLAKNNLFEITIVDKRNHHVFQPLLYQVATGALSPADISIPIRTYFSGYSNVRVMMDEVRDIDIKSKRLACKKINLHYDTLILACGSSHGYFSHVEWERFAPGLKTLEHALEIRRRIFTAFEEAELETDSEKKNALLTFCVVGGGPTGVELAGALGEIARFTIAREFRSIDPQMIRVFLLEGGPRILPQLPESLSHSAQKNLERLGVTVHCSSFVTHMDSEKIQTKDATIPTRTILWAAGVSASTLNGRLPFDRDRQGRILVDTQLHVKGQTSIYCIGDQASIEGAPLPGLASVAIQQGIYVAHAILNDSEGKSNSPFRYRDKGVMATIGRRTAVAMIGGLKLDGFVAWLMWGLVHIAYLIGFRNKILVLTQWAWSYVRYKRGTRLITNSDWQDVQPL